MSNAPVDNNVLKRDSPGTSSMGGAEHGGAAPALPNAFEFCKIIASLSDKYLDTARWEQVLAMCKEFQSRQTAATFKAATFTKSIPDETYRIWAPRICERKLTIGEYNGAEALFYNEKRLLPLEQVYNLLVDSHVDPSGKHRETVKDTRFYLKKKFGNGVFLPRVDILASEFVKACPCPRCGCRQPPTKTIKMPPHQKISPSSSISERSRSPANRADVDISPVGEPLSTFSVRDQICLTITQKLGVSPVFPPRTPKTELFTIKLMRMERPSTTRASKDEGLAEKLVWNPMWWNETQQSIEELLDVQFKQSEICLDRHMFDEGLQVCDLLCGTELARGGDLQDMGLSRAQEMKVRGENCSISLENIEQRECIRYGDVGMVLTEENIKKLLANGDIGDYLEDFPTGANVKREVWAVVDCEKCAETIICIEDHESQDKITKSKGIIGTRLTFVGFERIRGSSDVRLGNLLKPKRFPAKGHVDANQYSTLTNARSWFKYGSTPRTSKTDCSSYKYVVPEGDDTRSFSENRAIGAQGLGINVDHANSPIGYAQVRLVKNGKQTDEDISMILNMLEDLGFPVQAFYLGCMVAIIRIEPEMWHNFFDTFQEGGPFTANWSITSLKPAFRIVNAHALPIQCGKSSVFGGVVRQDDLATHFIPFQKSRACKQANIRFAGIYDMATVDECEVVVKKNDHERQGQLSGRGFYEIEQSSPRPDDVVFAKQSFRRTDTVATPTLQEGRWSEQRGTVENHRRRSTCDPPSCGVGKSETGAGTYVTTHDLQEILGTSSSLAMTNPQASSILMGRVFSIFSDLTISPQPSGIDYERRVSDLVKGATGEQVGDQVDTTRSGARSRFAGAARQKATTTKMQPKQAPTSDLSTETGPTQALSSDSATVPPAVESTKKPFNMFRRMSFNRKKHVDSFRNHPSLRPATRTVSKAGKFVCCLVTWMACLVLACHP
jgi:hypothetical protein